jgi:hypothetical protein
MADDAQVRSPTTGPRMCSLPHLLARGLMATLRIAVEHPLTAAPSMSTPSRAPMPVPR